MWRCVGFMAAVALVCGAAKADYLYVRVDLGKAYQLAPTGGGVGLKGLPTLPGKLPVQEGPYVSAVIEIKSKMTYDGKKRDDGVYAQMFDHPWGKNGRFLVTPALTPDAIKYVKIVRESPAKEYEKTFKKDLASKDAAKILAAAKWAFHYALLPEFKGAMDELNKVAPKMPIAVNYRRVVAGLAKPPSAEDPALKGLIADLTKPDAARYHWVTGDTGFYAALTNLPTSFDREVKQRLSRLQETLETFYFWFVLQENLPQPPLPKHRQLLVVAASTDEFHNSKWGAAPFVGDGVVPRRDNFLLMSWRPLGDGFKALDHNNQELWKKYDLRKDWLISGAIWDKQVRDPFQAAFAQTLTLVQRAVEDEAELATLTREGTRQLLFASGILPRHVHTPEWIAQGLASYFETPPGAVYPGVGLPSWSNLISFNYFRGAKKFDRPAEVLTNVYTDRYYRAAQRDIRDLHDASSKRSLTDRLHEEVDMANSSAWAFVYYVIERRHQPQLLFRYCQELNSLPRDLDLDERALEACFAKAFDLGDAKSPTRIDERKLTALADAWFNEMSSVTLESAEIQNEYRDVRRMSAKKTTIP